MALPDARPLPAPEAPADALGRTTPQGTVLGFLKAIRKEDYAAAAQYLNTRLKGSKSTELARELFVVLDRRLPPRLNEISNKPDGSHPFLTRPDQDLVGTIKSENGNVDIIVEKITRKKNSPIWLFSNETLDSIPALYDEVSAGSKEITLPAFLAQPSLFQVRRFNWVLILGLPVFYLIAGLLGQWLGTLIGLLRRHLREDPALPDPVILSPPLRLILTALLIRWILSEITLTLLARQFWSIIAATLAIVGCAWLLMLLNGRAESFFRRRLEGHNRTGATSVLRLGRRTIDGLVIVTGFLIGLNFLGVNATAALAGLGVGGIAIALAAQKTLENVIGGISIISDQAVRVGDLLSVGSSMGFVEYIGLRSTRIRTFDRTAVIVPNGQLATLQLENYSPRDRFWFHPTLNLQYGTTPESVRSIVGSIRKLLAQHPHIDTNSMHVRFVGFGPPLQIEIFSYVRARDWGSFQEIQEELLLQIMDIVEAAGTRIALPSQTTYLATDSASLQNYVEALLDGGHRSQVEDAPKHIGEKSAGYKTTG